MRFCRQHGSDQTGEPRNDGGTRQWGQGWHWAAGETGGENGNDIRKGEEERKSELEKIRLWLYSNDKRTQLWQSGFLWSCNRGGSVDVETLKRSNKACGKLY